MEAIRLHRGSESTSTVFAENKDISHIQIEVEDAPVRKTIETFWQMGDIPESDSIKDVSEPPGQAALLKGLGTPPLWRGHEHFIDAMKFIYPNFTKTCKRIIMNENIE